MADDNSANAIGNELKDVFARLLTTQGRALVVERQPAVIDRDDELLAAVAAAQAEARDQAAAFLSSLIGDAIEKLAARADRALNMTGALDKIAFAPGGNRTGVAAQLGRVADLAESAAVDSGAFADDLAGWSDGLDKLTARLEAAIDAAIGEDAGKARLAELQERIDAQRAEIDEAIDAIVTSADDIGERVSSFVTGVIETIKVGGKRRKRTDETKKPGGKTDPDDGDEAEDSDNEDSDSDDSKDGEGTNLDLGGKEADIKGIKTAARKAGDLGSAAARIARGNETLGSLYRELARVRSEIAWARAVGTQTKSLAESGRRAAASATGIADGWQAIAARLRDLATMADEPEKLAQAWASDRTHLWAPLGLRMSGIRAALTGRATIFPSAGK